MKWRTRLARWIAPDVFRQYDKIIADAQSYASLQRAVAQGHSDGNQSLQERFDQLYGETYHLMGERSKARWRECAGLPEVV